MPVKMSQSVKWSDDLIATPREMLDRGLAEVCIYENWQGPRGGVRRFVGVFTPDGRGVEVSGYAASQARAQRPRYQPEMLFLLWGALTDAMRKSYPEWTLEHAESQAGKFVRVINAEGIGSVCIDGAGMSEARRALGIKRPTKKAWGAWLASGAAQ